MSFVPNGGKFKLYTVPNALLFSTPTQHDSKNVLDVDCQTQVRLKLMIELYVSAKSVINGEMFVTWLNVTYYAGHAFVEFFKTLLIRFY
jgi:hypothetical protein